MTILRLFIQFLNNILSIEILNTSLFDWLINFTILIFGFRIIYELAKISIKNNKEKSDKND